MTKEFQAIQTTDAPKALGPYSQGVKIVSSKDLLFVSGQLPIDLSTGQLIKGDIQEMTHLVIDHLEKILLSGGGNLKQVLRVDIFLKSLKDFSLVNGVYATRFTGEVLPVRQTIEVSELPLGAALEMSCIGFVS